MAKFSRRPIFVNWSLQNISRKQFSRTKDTALYNIYTNIPVYTLYNIYTNIPVYTLNNIYRIYQYIRYIIYIYTNIPVYTLYNIYTNIPVYTLYNIYIYIYEYTSIYVI